MRRTFSQLMQLKTAMWVNAFLYYFRRLWLVGKWMPETAFANERLKGVFTVVAAVLRQLLELVSKLAYLGLFMLLPILGFTQSGVLQGRELDLLIHLMLVLSCLGGALMESQIFSVTREKITGILYLRMDGRQYVRSYLMLKYVPFFLWFLVALFAAVWYCGGTPGQTVLLWLLLLGTRMAGEALQLWYFDRTGKVLSRNLFFEWGVMLVAMLAAYVPPALGWLWPATYVLHPVVVPVVTALGGVCFYYIFWGYQGFSQKLHRSINPAYLFSNALKASSGGAEVAIKAKDLRTDAGAEKRFQGLEGYSYFNALFFARHRRQLVRPVYYRLAFVAGFFLAAVALWATNREAAIGLSQNLTLILPSVVYIMYCMSVGEKACKAMFYNCDVSMLRHGFYRRPRTILHMFRIRLVRVSLYNLCVGGALCLAAIGFCLLCGVPLLRAELLLFCASVLLLSVFFTAHHLCMYYIFQPYAADMQMKNPFYRVINGIVFLLCFLCLMIPVGSLTFTLLVLGVTAAYITVGLTLVYRLAPTTFRVK